MSSYDQQGVSGTSTLCEKESYHIFSCEQQGVSDIVQFMKGSLITSFPIIHSKWVTLHTWRESHHIFSYVQQEVSGIAHFVIGSLIASFPMTGSLWVTLYILWMGVSSHLFLWWTGSEWHSIFCGRESHHICSFDQQRVGDITHFVKGSLITCFPMIDSLWVTLHVLWKQISWFIPSFAMTNSKWVTLHILWTGVSSHLSSQPTGGEWHFTFCETVSSHLSYDQ